MTYESLETSVESSAPLELFEFTMSPLSWRYTNHVDDVDLGANSYLAENISRSIISQSDEINRSDLIITVPRSFIPAQRFKAIPPAEPMLFRLLKTNFGDSGYIVAWQGRVMAVAWEGAEAEITCEPIFSSLRRPGFRRYYSYICAHSLYGQKCQVVAEPLRVTSNVISINESTLEIQGAASKPDAYFSGGYIEYLTEEGLLEQRMIISHAATTIDLASAPADLVNGSEVSIFPGCDHTIATCQAKFANKNNYGGFPYIPTGSPFSGKTLF